MIQKLVFATNNRHKLEEIQNIAGKYLKILSLADINCHDEIPETTDTLEGNALIKAQWVKEKYGYDCFADDTGLEIEALGGKPGVYSARYAGEKCIAADNVAKVLSELRNIPNRKAAFRTVIALIQGEETHLFEGKICGEIIDQTIGTDGFGYDPIFRPTGYKETFAQMGADEKNKISHRALATAQLITYLTNKKNNSNE